MRSHAVAVAEPSWLRRTWVRFSDYAIVIVLLFALFALCFGVYNGWVAKNNSAVAEANSQAAKALAVKSLRSQNNHHAATVKTDAQLTAALDEVKKEAAAIEYLGGVIVYQNGEIINAQQQGHALVMDVAAITSQLAAAESSIGGALTAGQKAQNTYLLYLTCIGTNPTNTAVCGAAPPLPPT